MLWLRRSVAGVSSQRPGLDPRPVYEIYGVQSATGTSIHQSRVQKLCSFKAIQPMHLLTLIIRYSYEKDKRAKLGNLQK